jgi:hypothetical protein
MTSSGMLHRVALVITDVSEELSASIIRVARIGELGTTLAVTSIRRTLLGISSQRVCKYCKITKLNFEEINTYCHVYQVWCDK